MKDLKKRAIIAALVAVAVGLLALLLGGSLREVIVIPILYAFWVVSLVINSLPQVVYWAVFLTIALIVAWRSLRGSKVERGRSAKSGAKDWGRVAALTRWVHESAFGEYFKRRLARHLLELTLETEGYHTRLSTEHARQLLDSNALPLPPEALTYLMNGLTLIRGTDAYRFWDQWWLAIQSRLSLYKIDVANDPNLVSLVQHLEDELEMTT